MSKLPSIDSANLLTLKEKFNKFTYSPISIIVFAILTLAAFVFSLELVFYTLVVAYGIAIIALCPDLSPIIPLFTLCYITASKKNNPGFTDKGIFYGSTATFMICIISVVIIALILRITLDKNIGWKKFFTMRRSLLSGMLILSISYLISGLGSEHYAQFAKQNLVFASIQALSVFFLYFVFSATVDWEKFDVDFFAYSQLISGLVVVFELIWIYLTEDVIIGGFIDREKIFTGWGTYNNIGIILAMALPFAFYFACKKKHGIMYMIPALLLMIGVAFSCSRATILFASIAFVIAYIYTFSKTKNKKEFRILSVIILIFLIVALIVAFASLKDIFKNVPTIADIVNGDIVFNDYDRFNIYKQGFDAFKKNPIFGQTFYTNEYLFDWSEVEQFSSFFPPRWHNTLVQLLASCGIIGLCAYMIHRFQTIRLFLKRRGGINVYIGISIFTLLCMSLLDNHFFNVAPVMIYSIALAVVEYGKPHDK